MKLKDALHATPYVGYGGSSIPLPKDDLVRDALRNLQARTPEEIEAELAGFTLEDRETLDVFAVRMASLAVRTGEVRHVRDGLFALDMAARSGPIILEGAAPLFHACRLLDLDPRQEFLAFAARATRLRQSAEAVANKGIPLESGQYREGRDADGFRFMTMREHGLQS